MAWLPLKDRDLALYILYPQSRAQCLEQRERLLVELVGLDKLGRETESLLGVSSVGIKRDTFAEGSPNLKCHGAGLQEGLRLRWHWDSLQEALKVTRTLTMGRPRERAPAPLWGWIQTKVTREGRGIWHTLPTGSFHRDISRTPPDPEG